MEQIRALDRLGLLKLWERIRTGQPLAGWAEGTAFEYLVLRAFELEEAQVVWPYFVSRSEQIDGAVFVDGLSCLVESKHQSHMLGFGPIARFKARLDRRPPGAIGLFFSVSGFTEPAVEEAMRHPTRNVILWKGADITYGLLRGMRVGLQLKWRKAVEMATPDYALGKKEGS